MSIPVSIFDNRTEKQFVSHTDKLPIRKIIKTPGITMHCISFILEKYLIIIEYHFNETFNHQFSFRRYDYPKVELNDLVIDDLIDVIYNKLYLENVNYINFNGAIEYPQDAVLDKLEYKGMTLLKYYNKYSPLIEITFEEKKEELSDSVKKILLSEEPDFECPEEYKEIEWSKYLGFQPSNIEVEEFDEDIKLFQISKEKLRLLVYHFIRKFGSEDFQNRCFTVAKVSNHNIIVNNRVIDKLETKDSIIYKCKENTNLSLKMKLI